MKTLGRSPKKKRKPISKNEIGFKKQKQIKKIILN
jgi:hypothetical protein